MAENNANDMMVIVRGDQYAIPVMIKQGDVLITDQNADGVKVCFDTAVASWPGGGLTFDEGLWLYPLTQELSLSMQEGKVEFAVQVKMGSTIVTSKPKMVRVDDSNIKGVW